MFSNGLHFRLFIPGTTKKLPLMYNILIKKTIQQMEIEQEITLNIKGKLHTGMGTGSLGE